MTRVVGIHVTNYTDQPHRVNLVRKSTRHVLICAFVPAAHFAQGVTEHITLGVTRWTPSDRHIAPGRLVWVAPPGSELVFKDDDQLEMCPIIDGVYVAVYDDGGNIMAWELY